MKGLFFKESQSIYQAITDSKGDDACPMSPSEGLLACWNLQGLFLNTDRLVGPFALEL